MTAIAARKRMFPELTDAELDSMTARAWREAVRCHREWEQSVGHASPELRNILAAGSSDATMYWVACRDEQTARRAAGGAE